MKILKFLLAALIFYAAVKTNISMLSESNDSASILGVLTADVLFGFILYFLLRPKE